MTQPTSALEDPRGEPLERLLGAPMDVGRFLSLAIGIAVALGKVHQRGFIHKDIKPGNILLNSASGELHLTGFAVASRLLRERQLPDPPESIAGTLPYMAPEQTGRMNRSIDSRSDLYSLGVTYYQMLTGRLPFTASDPMEWVHSHIARKPLAPNELSKTVPAPISAIVMRLLAKTPEDRYQTAAGVESDLQRCSTAWKAHGHIDEFPLGEHDVPDRLLVPEKLYGRSRETEVLLASFDRVVRGGTPELVLVSGYSGVGKSSFVNELHKVLVPPRGLFASGKFDQYKRDIPYATLAQAFQSLVRPLLGRNDADLEIWRSALSEALGPNGLLMVELVPELKLIVGEQPPVPELSPQDAQSRFHMVFRRFIGIFARAEHPLTLFLDDLQWLDAATLDLLEYLLTRADVRHLLLIAAYRDNEVGPGLTRKLEAIRSAGSRVQEIILAPLTIEHLGQLMADSLRSEPGRVGYLTDLVHAKTAGNPFFAIQFVTALAEEGLLTFDRDERRWSWDLNRIHAKGYTDNVVDLMVSKLNRLPLETQKALQRLACLGHSAEFSILRIVYEDLDADIDKQLWEAVRTGLIFRSEDSYWFLHDRVQEAAYSMIPGESRAAIHLRIGHLLAEHTPAEKREERIFEIVNQLNRGSHLITSSVERDQVARLNLIAGKHAKTSTAYVSALFYLAAGRKLLTDESWSTAYDLIFSLEHDMAECEFLSGQAETAEGRLANLASRAANLIDLATVACLRVDLYTALDQNDRAIAVCLEYLRNLGVEWMPHPTENEVRQEYERIWSQLGDRTIEQLIELPVMRDPASLATLDVLTKAVPPTYYCDENLSSLVICRIVNMSLEDGNADGSCVAYEFFAMIVGPRFGNYEAGPGFGRLGYELVEKRGLKRYQARTYMCFGNIVMPWSEHIRAGRDLLHRAFDSANQMGDLTFAAYSRSQLITNLLAAGDPLETVQREAEHGLAFAMKARLGLVTDIITAQLGLIQTLRGLTPKFGSFDGGGFDELRFEQHLSSGVAEAECWYLIRKLQGRFFAGDYAAAVEASLMAQRLLWTSPSQFVTAEFRFYSALAHAACWDSGSSELKEQHFEALTTHHAHLAVWSENCPENFENRAALVAAEIARIEGREPDAMRLYERAIRSAHENGFVHNEGIANEAAGRFFLGRGLQTSAYAHLQKASACYAQWGAEAKVAQLDSLYPGAASPERAQPAAMGSSVRQLDIATVIKASQTVSSEIVLPRLIERLMTIALQSAGADRGLLLLPQKHGYQVVAEAWTSGEEVMLRQGAAADASAPESIVRYVIRTLQRVILDDAVKPNLFSEDDYLGRRQPRSLLCLPLMRQGVLGGLLYLENTLTSHAFTPGRMALLEVLASQAAISLENTRLYSDLEERETKVRGLQTELAHANRVETMGQLSASIAHEINQPLAAMVTNARAALRWLAGEPSDAEEVRQALDRIVRDGDRAANVVGRIRALFKKAPPRKEGLEINDAIQEVIALTQGEMMKSRVSVRSQLVEGLPLVQGDRVQLQQVVLNLIINAVEAMSGIGEGSRELVITTATAGSGQVLVTVQDSGPGLSPTAFDQVFEAFYSTKPGGLGIGLSICRSIIEAHGGRLWASANVPRGASFQFTLPVHQASEFQAPAGD